MFALQITLTNTFHPIHQPIYSRGRHLGMTPFRMHSFLHITSPQPLLCPRLCLNVNSYRIFYFSHNFRSINLISSMQIPIWLTNEIKLITTERDVCIRSRILFFVHITSAVRIKSKVAFQYFSAVFQLVLPLPRPKYRM